MSNVELPAERPDTAAIQQTRNGVDGLIRLYVLMAETDGSPTVATHKIALRIAKEAPALLEHIDTLLLYVARLEAEARAR